MAKYIRQFNSVEAATSATDLVSPNVTSIATGGATKLLMKDTGTTDAPLEIKVEGGEIVIKEKPATEIWEFYNDISWKGYEGDYNVNFVCNSKSYKQIQWVSCEKLWYEGINDEDTKRVFHVDYGWTEQYYRTITLSEPAVEGTPLHTFLSSVAIKKS